MKNAAAPAPDPSPALTTEPWISDPSTPDPWTTEPWPNEPEPAYPGPDEPETVYFSDPALPLSSLSGDVSSATDVASPYCQAARTTFLQPSPAGRSFGEPYRVYLSTIEIGAGTMLETAPTEQAGPAVEYYEYVTKFHQIMAKFGYDLDAVANEASAAERAFTVEEKAIPALAIYVDDACGLGDTVYALATSYYGAEAAQALLGSGRDYSLIDADALNSDTQPYLFVDDLSLVSEFDIIGVVHDGPAIILVTTDQLGIYGCSAHVPGAEEMTVGSGTALTDVDSLAECSDPNW